MCWRTEGSRCPARRPTWPRTPTCAGPIWVINVALPPHESGEVAAGRRGHGSRARPVAHDPSARGADLNRLAGRPAGRPRPLEIVAAQPAGDVDRLADDMETR